MLEDVDVGAVCGLVDTQDGAEFVERVPLVLAAVGVVGDDAVVAVFEPGGHGQECFAGGVGGGALGGDDDVVVVFDELMGVR